MQIPEIIVNVPREDDEEKLFCCCSQQPGVRNDMADKKYYDKDGVEITEADWIETLKKAKEYAGQQMVDMLEATEYEGEE